jgi:predicted acetyltransferase
MTQSHPIRAIGAGEFAALAQVDAHAFLEPWPAEALLHEQITAEFDRTFAALDGDQMVGSGANYTFELTVPGGTVPAAGVTRIAVLPSHRRRGILTSMMARLFADAADRAEPVAVLFASESAIYSRFGFGLASMYLDLTIRRGEGRLVPGVAAPSRSDAVRLRAAEPLAVRAELAAVFEADRALRPGMLARNENWWTSLLTDVPALRPAGSSPVRCLLAEDAYGPRGYALYRTRPRWDDAHLAEGVLQIREMHALDPAATTALWSDLLARDLVGEVNARMRPLDEPLLALLADPRRARSSAADGLWLRLLDLPAALRQRRYAAAADLVLDIIDPVIAANDGRWRLQAAGPGGGPASCERTEAAADVRLTVAALGAGYLGGAQFSQLAAAGHVAELSAGAVATLGTALSWDRPPFSGMVF